MIPAADRGPRAVAWLSEASLTGILLRVPCERSVVRETVARMGRLQLASDSGSSPDVHPVHLEVWRLSAGSVRVGPMAPYDVVDRLARSFGGPIGAWWSEGAKSFTRRVASYLSDYDEVMLSVPGVVLGDRPADVHSLVLGMMTDSPLARLADRALGFGYRKESARFCRPSSGILTVETADGRLRIAVAPRDVEESSAPDVSELEAVFRSPLLGLCPDGRLARSWLRRSLRQSDAQVRSAAFELEVADDVWSHLLPRRASVGPYCATASRGGAIEFTNLRAAVSHPQMT